LDINSHNKQTQVKGINNDGFITDGITNDELKRRIDYLKSIESNNNNNLKLKWLYTICCMKSQIKTNVYEPNRHTIKNQANVITEEEKAKQDVESVKEKPFWQNVNNINAIILLVIASYIYGVYA
jgi:SET domain-containing protein